MLRERERSEVRRINTRRVAALVVKRVIVGDRADLAFVNEAVSAIGSVVPADDAVPRFRFMAGPVPATRGGVFFELLVWGTSAVAKDVALRVTLHPCDLEVRGRGE